MVKNSRVEEQAKNYEIKKGENTRFYFIVSYSVSFLLAPPGVSRLDGGRGRRVVGRLQGHPIACSLKLEESCCRTILVLGNAV